MSRGRVAVVASLLLTFAILSASSASAQPPGLTGIFAGALRQEVAPDPPRTFGTATEVAHVVGAWEFNEFSGDATTSSFGERACVAAPCGLLATVRLPAGALVSRIELDACDNNAGGQIRFQLFRTDSPWTGTTTDLTDSDTTGIAATPGCAIFPLNATSPVTIDNKNFNYLLNVVLSGNVANLNFSAVRVYYTLQVSPAPGAASFTDVPTSHPFHQYIEALVASGITAGCGGGNYCPDAPLTRGQMAVFLSKGLGLHFAP